MQRPRRLKTKIYRKKRNVSRSAARSSTIQRRRTSTTVVPRYIRPVISETKEAKITASFGLFSVISNNFGIRMVQPVSLYPPSAGSPEIFGVYIDQGVGQSQRIGNRIQLTGCYVKGYITVSKYDYLTNPSCKPCFVRIYIFSMKESANLTDNQGAAVDLCQNRFFQNNNTAQGFTGTISDCSQFINTDCVTLHKVINRKVGFEVAEYAGTGATFITDNRPFQYFHNNEYKHNAFFKFSALKYMRKNIVYHDNSNVPSGRKVWMAFNLINPYGAVIPSVETPCSVNYTIRYRYKDA